MMEKSPFLYHAQGRMCGKKKEVNKKDFFIGLPLAIKMVVLI